MRSFRLAAFMLVFVSIVVSARPAPAAAELDPRPTISWGVEGLATGTGIDRIRSEVFAIEQIGNRVYVGGRFTRATNGVTSVAQPFLAAFDSTTGEFINSFRPRLNNAVLALAASPDGSKLFVGGSFTTVNGVSTSAVAALNPTTGAPVAGWTGRVGGYNMVRTLEVDGNWLYAGGSFTAIGSSTGNTSAARVGRFAVGNGRHDVNWRPRVQDGTVWGIAVSQTYDRVYLAGSFRYVNGADKTGGFVAVGKSNQANVQGVAPFQYNTVNEPSRWLHDVVVADGNVFVAGSEHLVQVMRESDLTLKLFHISEPNRGDYQTLEVVGDRVYSGCHCRRNQVLNTSRGIRWFGRIPDGASNAPVIDRSFPNSWALALDSTSGAHVDSFDADIRSDGPGVWAIHGAPDGCVWFGGSIHASADLPQRNIVRMCEGGGQGPDTTAPSAPGAPTPTNVGQSSVQLTWTRSTDNVGVAGYRVINAANNQVVATAPSNLATVSGLAPGSYRFYIQAYDSSGNTTNGPTRTIEITGGVADTQRPSTPGRARIVSTAAGSVSVEWFASTDNVGVTGYRIFNYDTGEVITDVRGTSTTITNLATGQYRIYIKAYDAAGNVSWRSGLTTIQVSDGARDTVRPSTPKGLRISGIGANAVSMFWKGSTDNVGVVGYRLFDASNNQVLADVSALQVRITGVPAGTHRYYVKAYDAAGNLSWRTNIVTATIGV